MPPAILSYFHAWHAVSAADGVIPGTGHFHVLIDEDQQYEEGDTIPFDDTHKHYGKGQKDVDVDLQPVRHLHNAVRMSSTFVAVPHTALCQGAPACVCMLSLVVMPDPTYNTSSKSMISRSPFVANFITCDGSFSSCYATPSYAFTAMHCTGSLQGKHKLTLQFANALHQSYGPKYAASIMVTVN